MIKTSDFSLNLLLNYLHIVDGDVTLLLFKNQIVIYSIIRYTERLCLCHVKIFFSSDLSVILCYFQGGGEYNFKFLSVHILLQN